MDIAGKIVAITGAGRGLGAALAVRCAEAGAKAVCISDINESDIQETVTTLEAKGTQALGLKTDVSQEHQIQEMIETIEQDMGPIDLFVANAGIAAGDKMADGKIDLKNGAAYDLDNVMWQKAWDINVMHHVWVARHLVPRMKQRGGGYIATVASAAGLLAQIGDASYTATKHAAVGFANSLAVTHGDDGIVVSCICPQYVQSQMQAFVDKSGMTVGDILTPDQYCNAVFAGIEKEEFLILPHQAVTELLAAKTSNWGQWIDTMRYLRRKFIQAQRA